MALFKMYFFAPLVRSRPAISRRCVFVRGADLQFTLNF